MIVRVLTARVRPESAGEFNDLLRRQLPILKEHDGLIYVKLAHQVHRDREEVMLFEEWRDLAALYVWTGPDIGKPRLLPGAEALVDDLSVTHYEALDVDIPDDA